MKEQEKPPQEQGYIGTNGKIGGGGDAKSSRTAARKTKDLKGKIENLNLQIATLNPENAIVPCPCKPYAHEDHHCRSCDCRGFILFFFVSCVLRYFGMLIFGCRS